MLLGSFSLHVSALLHETYTWKWQLIACCLLNEAKARCFMLNRVKWFVWARKRSLVYCTNMHVIMHEGLCWHQPSGHNDHAWLCWIMLNYADMDYICWIIMIISFAVSLHFRSLTFPWFVRTYADDAWELSLPVKFTMKPLEASPGIGQLCDWCREKWVFECYKNKIFASFQCAGLVLAWLIRHEQVNTSTAPPVNLIRKA